MNHIGIIILIKDTCVLGLKKINIVDVLKPVDEIPMSPLLNSQGNVVDSNKII